MERKTSKWLGFLAGMGLALWLWQRERTSGDPSTGSGQAVNSRVKYALIRGTQSAR
jgi:hypothetical protein